MYAWVNADIFVVALTDILTLFTVASIDDYYERGEDKNYIWGIGTTPLYP